MTEKVGEARRLLRETGANVESNVVFTLKEWTEIDKQAAQLEERVRELEDELVEIQQIASSRGLDSQNTYDSVLEDIEDRCLKVLKGKS